MSLYKELNDINMDLDAYEELELTSFQKKKWESRILKKIRSHKTNHKKKLAGLAVVVVLATGISLSSGIVSFANVPFIGGLIEGYGGFESQKKMDYTPYKTEIGTTAENEYGKWTLNEVMIDSGRLLISSTFEPAKEVDFNYQMHPMPKVLMNGQNLTSGTGGQSIEINDSKYTIYNEVRMNEIPIGETIQFHITYDNIDWSADKKEVPVGVAMDQPWVFDINVPTEQLAATSRTIQFNQEVPLENGYFIRLDKLVVTPSSTILYYDWPEQANHIAFKIVSESGVEILPGSATISDEEQTYNRYSSIDLQAEKYYLVPYETSTNTHAIDPGKVPELSIPINP
ncbi:DUF4179 domain-containing protein [Paenibacillus antarcticus]|uniref:DUF4179 domain-containing protein n=1 Tax=Paenibacillus antarcticus TaxID=253703 RepID=A0A168MN34_9BACL|nr:DUF4179 domain-containing protein [Paenibacillus antarcticus]OAB44864.1 hypothetical protein PBAT_14880 [Paenibacillus antarcticus]